MDTGTERGIGQADTKDQKEGLVRWLRGQEEGIWHHHNRQSNIEVRITSHKH